MGIAKKGRRTISVGRWTWLSWSPSCRRIGWDESEKVTTGDGDWRHSVIRLKSDSDDPAFEPIVLRDLADCELRNIAELVEVL